MKFLNFILVLGFIIDYVRGDLNSDRIDGPALRQLSSPGVSRSESLTKCSYAPDVVMVVDVTNSHEEYMAALRQYLPDLFDYFEKELDGHPRFSIVSFTDKPLPEFGESDDFCANVDLPLTTMNTKRAKDLADITFSNLVTDGGGDILDGANDALFRTAVSQSVGWSPSAFNDATGRPIKKIIILLTNAPVHDPRPSNDTEYTLKDLSSMKLLTDEAAALNADINHKCNLANFPDASTLRKSLVDNNIVPVVLAGKHYYLDWLEEKPKLYKAYEDLMKRHDSVSSNWGFFDDGLANYYTWFLEKFVQLPEFHVDNLFKNGVNLTDPTRTTLLKDIVRKVIQQQPVPRCKPKEGVKYDTDPEATDCLFSEWSEWSPCSLSCDPLGALGVGGEQTRSRTITRPKTFDGKECPYLVETKAGCNRGVACPVDCAVSDWSDWGACTVMCDANGPKGVGGMQMRTRTITVPRVAAGKPCPQLREAKQGCNKGKPCPIDCLVSVWSGWSACSQKCGPDGKTTRTKTINRHPAHNGKACPAELTETMRCNENVVCAVDCVTSDWSEWSGCSVKCDSNGSKGSGGQKTRTRTVVVAKTLNGKDCGDLTQTRHGCNKGVACAVSANQAPQEERQTKQHDKATEKLAGSSPEVKKTQGTVVKETPLVFNSSTDSPATDEDIESPPSNTNRVAAGCGLAACALCACAACAYAAKRFGLIGNNYDEVKDGTADHDCESSKPEVHRDQYHQVVSSAYG